MRRDGLGVRHTFLGTLGPPLCTRSQASRRRRNVSHWEPGRFYGSQSRTAMTRGPQPHTWHSGFRGHTARVVAQRASSDAGGAAPKITHSQDQKGTRDSSSACSRVPAQRGMEMSHREPLRPLVEGSKAQRAGQWTARMSVGWGCGGYHVGAGDAVGTCWGLGVAGVRGHGDAAQVGSPR